MSELVPEIRFEGFEGEWVMDDLGSIAEMYQPETISGRDFTEYGFPVFGANGYIGHYSEANHWEDQVTVSARGAVGIPSYVPAPVWITGNSMVIRVAPSKRDKRFLYYSLQAGRAALQRVSAGGVQQQLTREVLRSVGVSGTSLPEQKRIASLLADLDDSIDQHRRKHQQLKQTEASLMERMFPAPGETVPQVRFGGFDEGWVERRLGDLGPTYGGLSGKQGADFGHGSARYVPYMQVMAHALITDASDFGVIEVDPKQREVRTGDALFTISSETPEEVGMAAVWLGTGPNIYLNSFCFGLRPVISHDSQFFAYALRSEAVREQLVLLAQGISRFNISKTRAMDTRIHFPPTLAEQQAIGAFFARLDALIEAEQHRVEKLQQVKAALLQKMFV